MCFIVCDAGMIGESTCLANGGSNLPDGMAHMSVP